MTRLFVDTSYAVALVSRTDAHHGSALGWAARVQAGGVELVTTRAVMLEIGNALARQRFRRHAVALLKAFERDSTVWIEPVTEERYAAAFELFSLRADKEWSLTDCISILVMQELGLADALTADEHFAQAGFKALLREPLPA